MNLQNGYKVIYEKAAGGKRTFYASKCDGTSDKELASFTDSEYRGRMIYEHDGRFYISAEATPKYDEDGKPASGETVLSAFDEVFVKVEPDEAHAPAQANEHAAPTDAEPNGDEPAKGEDEGTEE